MTVTLHQFTLRAAAMMHRQRGASGVSLDAIKVEADQLEQWLIDDPGDEDTNRAALLAAAGSIGSNGNAASLLTRAKELKFLIEDRTLTDARIEPATAVTIEVGESLQLACVGEFVSGQEHDITNKAYWWPQDDTKISVTSREQDGPAYDAPGGLVTGLAVGSTNVFASHDGVSAPGLQVIVVAAPEE